MLVTTFLARIMGSIMDVVLFLAQESLVEQRARHSQQVGFFKPRHCAQNFRSPSNRVATLVFLHVSHINHQLFCRSFGVFEAKKPRPFEFAVNGCELFAYCRCGSDLNLLLLMLSVYIPV